MPLSRRSFLKTIGAAAATLPCLRLLESSAYAQAQAPLRFVAIMTPHGMIPELWTPQGTETDMNLTFAGSTLGPLDKFKKKLLVLDGIDMRVLYEKGSETGHRGAPCSLLTGTKVVDRGDDVYPTGPSIDQFLAKQLGGQTQFRSLELGTAVEGGTSSFNTINFSDTGQRLPNMIDPTAVFSRLFGSFTGAPTDDAAAKRILAKKQSVLDALTADLTRMNTRLAGPERAKLDQHLAIIRDIEHRLTLGGAGPTAGCQKPGTPATLNPTDGNNIPAVTKLHMDLMAQAFACDLTRFASLQIFHGGNFSTMPWIGLNMNVHDDLAHRMDDDKTARANLAKVHTWFAEQVGYFLGALDAIPEGNGTVLDNTIVLWGNELGNPSAHSDVNVPMILAGGGTRFRTGRHVKYSMSDSPFCDPGKCTQANQYSQQTAHNAVLVSIQQAFGIQSDTYGDPDYKGALPNLV